MPILWRYLLRSFFQVLGLCVIGFIAILLVTRVQEIARFATSGAPYLTIFLFTAYQIPFILAYALPISCLIAAILLFQKMSHTQELTALRASGVGLNSVAYPILLAGFCLSLLNFLVASEITPRCHIKSKELIYEMTAVNPLFLLQKETLVKFKNAYIDMKVLNTGKNAKNVVLVINNHKQNRLGLMTAKELSLDKDLLNGSHVSFISSIDGKKPDEFDHLVIENQATMSTKATNLSDLMLNKDWYGNHDYLTWRMLFAKEHLENQRFFNFKRSAKFEIFRRLSIGLSALTFTVIGMSFGMEIGRNRKKKGIIWAIALSSFFIVCFITAKSLYHFPFVVTTMYFLPHPVIIFLSLNSMKRVARGIE